MYDDDVYYDETFDDLEKDNGDLDVKGQDLSDNGDDELTYEDTTRDMEHYIANAESFKVAKPERRTIQEIYEAILRKIVELLEEMNSDLLSFIWKPEMQRLFNMLMACTVNDTEKSKEVCCYLCLVIFEFKFYGASFCHFNLRL